VKQLRIGDITIDAVIEREGPWRRPQDFFPAYDEGVFKRLRIDDSCRVSVYIGEVSLRLILGIRPDSAQRGTQVSRHSPRPRMRPQPALCFARSRDPNDDDSSKTRSGSSRQSLRD